MFIQSVISKFCLKQIQLKFWNLWLDNKEQIILISLFHMNEKGEQTFRLVYNVLCEKLEKLGFPLDFNVHGKEFFSAGFSMREVIITLLRLHSDNVFKLTSDGYRWLYKNDLGLAKPGLTILLKDIDYIKLMQVKYEMEQTLCPPTIKKRAIDLISDGITTGETGYSCKSKLEHCGLEKKYMPNFQSISISEELASLLNFLSTSPNEKEQNLLVHLIQEFCHPLWHKSNEEKALQKEDEISRHLKYDNLCVVDGKLQKLTSEIQKKIEERNKQEKSEVEKKKEDITDMDEPKGRKGLVGFDIEKSHLTFENKRCPIPRTGRYFRGYSIEYVVCDYAFNIAIELPMDWGEFYDEAFGEDADHKTNTQQKKALKDAINRINAKTLQYFSFEVLSYDKDFIDKK